MPSCYTYTATDPNDWEQQAATLLDQARGCNIWCLQGGLGAGKTCVVQALCKALGVEAPVTSPTFGLLHTYHTKEGKPIYHADLYRLKDIEEALAIGLEEYLSQETYCFIEWPAIILPLLPDRHVVATLTSEDRRHTITLQCHG